MVLTPQFCGGCPPQRSAGHSGLCWGWACWGPHQTDTSTPANAKYREEDEWASVGDFCCGCSSSFSAFPRFLPQICKWVLEIKSGLIIRSCLGPF